jgi:CPA2 family monovalent cation:H+ antiporter-2
MMQEDLFQLLVLMVTLSMVATPLLIEAANRIGARLRPTTTVNAVAATHSEGRVGHVIIAGFGKVGQRVAKILTSAGLPYIALDFDHNRVIDTRARGYSVYYGDARRAGVLRAAGATDARLIVLTLDDVESVKQAAIVVRELYSNLPIFARTRDHKTSLELIEIGAVHTVPEMFEASLQLGVSILRALGLPAEQVNHIEEEFRSQNYQKLGNIVTAPRDHHQL